jgi:sialic acid synthase SpsE
MFVANVIEKHFTLDRSDGGVDSVFSMEPAEMKQLAIETERAWQAMGKISYGIIEAEQKSIIFRRSLYVVQDMKAGDTFTPENLRAIRPGSGLPPKYYETVLGKQAKVAIKRGTPLTWEIF